MSLGNLAVVVSLASLALLIFDEISRGFGE